MDIQFDVFNYDVWGNDKDGFEVNDLFPQGRISLPESAVRGPDAELLTALREHNCFSGIRNRSIVIEGDPDYTLYFHRAQNHYPLGELRRVK